MGFNFNTTGFILVFLPALTALYWLARAFHPRLASCLLMLASILFYMLAQPVGLDGLQRALNTALLVGSIAFNYAIGSLILRRPLHGKTALIIGIAVNLAVLTVFKYANFVAANLEALTSWHLGEVAIELPPGISFFTFTQIAFLVDAYQRKVREQDPLNFALFVSYYPHLIAGPIMHHAQMMPQFADRSRKPIPLHLAIGLSVFAVGLFKKVVLADPAALYANRVFPAFDAGQVLSSAEAWIGALAYTMQLYFDFSGYSDMAVGLSFMLGVRLPINFYSPYQATSIIDFWRRWHMTLSAFLRDYLYIALGGNRNGAFARYRNLLLTMLIGGLWHGAAWSFVVWGGLHGAYLIINHLFRSMGGRLPSLVGWALTFIAVVVAWVFFRATTLAGASAMVATMFGGDGLPASGWQPWMTTASLHLAALASIALLLPNIYDLMGNYRPALLPHDIDQQIAAKTGAWQPTLASGLVYGTALMVALFFITRAFVPTEFLYFQF